MILDKLTEARAYRGIHPRLDEALDRLAARPVQSAMNNDDAPFVPDNYGGFGPTSEF